MVRSIAIATCLFVLSLGGPGSEAAEAIRKKPEATAATTEAATREVRHGVESIADEAAEFADDSSPVDGMTRATDELMGSEAIDGCTASIDSAECGIE